MTDAPDASGPAADRLEPGLPAVRFVLVRPQYPSNIGAAARAIRTMGFSQLWLVRPRRFPHPEAWRLATDAAEVLEQATVVDSLDGALADCVLSVGTSRRSRAADWPLLSPEALGREARGCAGPVALVFGPEPSGLTSDELYRCRFQSAIDTAPDCGSLNLAQAVQVYAYALRRAARATPPEAPREPATEAMLAELYRRIEETAVAVGFARYAPEHLMLRFRRLLNRARPSARESSMLTGLFARILERLGH